MLNAKMTCPLQTGNADVLLDYCARALDSERLSMLETHMQSCPACREMAASQSEIWSALDAYDAEPISADFDRKLYARIEKLDQVPAWDRFWAPVREYLQGQPAWKPLVSLAAASAVVAFVFLVTGDPQPNAVEPAAIDVRVVEQTERVLEDLEMLRQLDFAPSSDSRGTKAPSEVF